MLQMLGDFPRAWSLLLEFIENAALSKSNEVSLAALKSFQEILYNRREEAENVGMAQLNKKESNEKINIDETDIWDVSISEPMETFHMSKRNHKSFCSRLHGVFG